MSNGWFPRFSAKGDIASGVGGIWVNGQRVGTEPDLQPHWLTNELLLVKGGAGADSDKPFSLRVSDGQRTLLQSIRAATYAAGAGKWQATDPAQGRIHVAVSRTGQKAWVTEYGGNNDDHGIVVESREVMRGSVHNVRVEDGLVVWTVKTPRKSGTGEIWGLRPGGQPESLRVFTHSWEDHAVPFMVNGQPWVLFQTNLDLRLHPWGDVKGYVIATGEDANLNPDVVFHNNQIKVAWNAKSGRLDRKTIPLVEVRVDTSAPWNGQPGPNPVCDAVYLIGESGNCPRCGRRKSLHTLKEPDVSIPNKREIVERVDREHPHLLRQNTKATCTEFLWRAVDALHDEDENFGLLTKSQGENHTIIAGHRVAVDAVAYKGSDEVVDIMRGAGDGPGTGGVAWGVDERRPSNQWLDPPPFEGGTEPTEPEKHAYDGGDNDTGTCDICGKPKADPIHTVTGGGGTDDDLEEIKKNLEVATAMAFKASETADSALELATKTLEDVIAKFAEVDTEIGKLKAAGGIDLTTIAARGKVSLTDVVRGNTVTLPLERK